ncbi:MAG: hypothetical protein K2H18_07550, partial [Muribaculaceae bacterium]|nr:hypothetical protein [Muribaculaceae bacterium]
MDSFYIYRLPGESDFVGGLGIAKNGLHPGYVISSFYNKPEATVSIIYRRDLSLDSINSIFNELSDLQSETDDERLLFPFPEFSTDKL